MLIDFGWPVSNIYDLYKERHGVELAFDARKNHLDADKTHMKNDVAMRGYFFLTFLAFRVYFGVLTRLREENLVDEICAGVMFFELSKQNTSKHLYEDKESFAQIPSSAGDIVDLFPESLPMV